jgi:hypothetical protein
MFDSALGVRIRIGPESDELLKMMGPKGKEGPIVGQIICELYFFAKFNFLWVGNLHIGIPKLSMMTATNKLMMRNEQSMKPEMK